MLINIKKIKFLVLPLIVVSFLESCGNGGEVDQSSTTVVEAENVGINNTLGFQCENQGEYTVDWGDGSSIDEHNSVHVYKSNLSKVTITITGIITSISFRTIWSSSLDNYLITSVEVGNGIQRLPNYAFETCLQLQSVIIPKSVIVIGEGIFDFCDNVVAYCKIESKPRGWDENWNSGRPCFWGFVKKSEENYFSYVVTEVGCYITKYSGTKTEIIIPNKLGESPVVGIYNNAFDGKDTITSVTLPTTLQSIGNYAFNDCISLSSINFPAGLTSIGEKAFAECVLLRDISLPNSLKKIDRWAFYRCYNFKEILIPTSVTIMGSSAFESCNNLTIYCEIESKPDEWANNWNSSKLPCIWGYINKGQDFDYSYVATKFGCYITKYEGSDTNLVIPDTLGGFSVIGILNNVFENRGDITSVTLPTTLKSIDNAAFRYCTNLSSINLPEDLTSIGSYAFNGCRNLQEVVIPTSVTEIGSSAFASCNNLTIYCEIESKPDEWSNNWNASNRPCFWGFIDKGNQGYYSYISTRFGSYITRYIGDDETDLIIPDTLGGFSVIGILNNVFENRGDITSVTLPTTLKSIGNYAFSGCTNLSSINLPEDLTSIGSYAFNGCKNLSSINLPEGLTILSDSAFKRCTNLSSINFPEGLTSIGNEVFCGTKLQNINLPEGLLSIGSEAFYDCQVIQEVVIPTSVTTIGNRAFYETRGMSIIDLTAFTDPNKLPSAGTDAFMKNMIYKTYPNFKVASSEMRDAFISKGGGWPSDKNLYTWPE